MPTSNASIGDAYASTEAGVGFAVNDGREGFPADMIGENRGVEMKVEDGSLLADCRASLASHKVPAVIRFVPALTVNAGGTA